MRLRYVCAMQLAFVVALSIASHHTADLTTNVAKTQTYVSAEVEGGRFDFDGAHGEYVALVPSAELAALPWLAIDARVPVVAAQFDDGSSAFGVADIELSAKATFFSMRALALSGGLGAELPTGDVAHHLGGGHVELAPFLAATTHPFNAPIPITFTALAADHVSFELSPSSGNDAGNATPEPAHGSVIAPHTDHEATLRMLVTAVPVEHVSVTIGADDALILTGPARAGPLTFVVQGGYALTHNVVVAGGFEAGIAGDVRLPLRVRGGVAYAW